MQNTGERHQSTLPSPIKCYVIFNLGLGVRFEILSFLIDQLMPTEEEATFIALLESRISEVLGPNNPIVLSADDELSVLPRNNIPSQKPKRGVDCKSIFSSWCISWLQLRNRNNVISKFVVFQPLS